jgi:hypothetical protein
VEVQRVGWAVAGVWFRPPNPRTGAGKSLMRNKRPVLFASRWTSCMRLRGRMDARQYKDEVRFLVFINYITDTCGQSSDLALPVVIPPGGSLIALLGEHFPTLREARAELNALTPAAGAWR